MYLLLLQVQQLLSRLESQASTDALTAVANRRRFDEALEQEWRRGLRSGDSLSLLLLDVDHFKLYNDQYGHVQGDGCLRQVASALAGQARRSTDLVCRIGGEEFAVLLPATAEAEALRLAQGIVSAIDARCPKHPQARVSDADCVVLLILNILSGRVALGRVGREQDYWKRTNRPRHVAG